MNTMYKEKRFTDVEIIVGPKLFDVRNVILAARSSVFAAVVERDFSESAQNRVVIADIEPDVMESFIDFLYTGKCADDVVLLAMPENRVGQFTMTIAPGILFNTSAFEFSGRGRAREEENLKIMWQVFYYKNWNDVRCNPLLGSYEVLNSGRTPEPSAIVLKILQTNYSRFIIGGFHVNIVGIWSHQDISLFKYTPSDLEVDIKEKNTYVILFDIGCLVNRGVRVDFFFPTWRAPHRLLSTSIATDDYAIQLTNQMKTMCKEKRFTDFEIIVGPKQFDVHKVILAARSSVFAAMLERDFSESAQNRVVIADIEPDVMESFIDFLYTGKCADEHAVGLLVCSEKYDVANLKLKCEDVLTRTLTCGNAGEVLHLADTYRAESLKQASLEFIARNLEEVMSTPGWKSMTPELLNDLLRATLKK